MPFSQPQKESIGLTELKACPVDKHQRILLSGTRDSLAISLSLVSSSY